MLLLNPNKLHMGPTALLDFDLVLHYKVKDKVTQMLKGYNS